MNAPFADLGISVFERGWLSSNNVLLAAPEAEENILIDSGYATHSQQTLGLVRAALRGRQLHRIINTHLHSDHCGGNFELQRAFDCKIDVPIGETDKVDRWDGQALSFEATGQQCPRFRRTGSIQSGSSFVHGRMQWKALAAPGHDPESIVLYEENEQILISADALWENGFGVVFPELIGEPGFGDVGRTLEMISALRVRWVIPGHGAPFAGIGAALDRARERLRRMEADPMKHAVHAAKVLLKFHLLEVQAAPVDNLRSWSTQVPYFARIQQEYFPTQDIDDLFDSLLAQLIASGSLRASGNVIVNV